MRPMSKIAFIDCTSNAYSGETLRTKPIGGIQSCTVNLAEHLVKLGHDVDVYNSVPEKREEYGVRWLPMPESIKLKYDLVIANNDASLFCKVKHDPSVRYVLWIHNPVRFLKTIKKGRWSAAFKYKPEGIFLSRYHKAACPPMIPFKTKHIIGHGIDDVFFDAPAPSLEGDEAAPRLPRAVFISQAYRGLKETAAFWAEHIAPYMREAELHVFCGDKGREACGDRLKRFEEANVIFRDPVPKAALIEEMKRARLMLYPGHEDETFCLSAVEAMACGLPLVTEGLGALKERVRDGEDGYILRDVQDRRDTVMQILKDDALFECLSKNAKESAKSARWDVRAQEWINHFLS